MSFLPTGSLASRCALGGQHGLAGGGGAAQPLFQDALVRLKGHIARKLRRVLHIDGVGALVELVGLAEQLIILGLKSNVAKSVAHGNAAKVIGFFPGLQSGGGLWGRSFYGRLGLRGLFLLKWPQSLKPRRLGLLGNRRRLRLRALANEGNHQKRRHRTTEASAHGTLPIGRAMAASPACASDFPCW